MLLRARASLFVYTWSHVCQWLLNMGVLFSVSREYELFCLYSQSFNQMVGPGFVILCKTDSACVRSFNLIWTDLGWKMILHS
jgi:hypothetical protein